MRDCTLLRCATLQELCQALPPDCQVLATENW